MKEMMAKAKQEKEAAAEKDHKEGIYKAEELNEKDKEFYKGLKDKTEKRFNEKTNNQPHDE